MTNKFGTPKKELIFRLVFSVAGLAMLGAAIAFRGLPVGPAAAEILGITTVFFGGTFLWTLWKLWKKDYPDGL